MKHNTIKYLSALLLFGTNGIVASQISLPSYQIVFLRALLGSGLLWLLFFLGNYKRQATQHLQQVLYILISGAAMGASWMFLYEAYQQIGVSIASMLYYVGPVIVMVLSPLLFHEKLTANKCFAFIVVLCGVLCINGGQTAISFNRWGIFCGGISALLYAVMVIANKKATHIAGLENASIQLFTSFLTVAIFVGYKTGYSFTVAPDDWLWIFLLGFLNTGIGCYLYFSAIGTLPVQTVAICGYLEPASAVIFSMLLLQETMQPLQIVGAVLILGGAMFGEISPQAVAKKQLQKK